MKKTSFYNLYNVNLAYANLAIRHPADIEMIDVAWGEHLASTGWTQPEWIAEIQRLRQEGLVRNALIAEGMASDVVDHAFDAIN